jgi:sulfate adenylyltransferase/3'-phosphoadenosine 5'-phosphosulfate synthase
LDGDEIRRNLSKGLGFSKEDRCENLRRLGFVAGVVARTGACAIAAAISPYREVRDQARGENPRFCEVYCECPISVLTARDPKGLYEKALRGEIKNFTGVTDPYEEPLSPEVRVHTDRETPLQSTDRIMARLEELGFLATTRSATSTLRIVNQVVPASAAKAVAAEAEQLPSLRLSSEQAELVDALALGLLSPVAGFMSAREQHCVLAEGRLEGGQAAVESRRLDGNEVARPGHGLKTDVQRLHGAGRDHDLVG